MRNNSFRIAILGAIIALITIAGIFIATLSLGHAFDSHSTPIVVTVIGVIGTCCTSLLALLAVTNVDSKVNGHIATLTTIATQAAAASGDPEIVKKAEEAVSLAQQVLPKNGKDVLLP